MRLLKTLSHTSNRLAMEPGTHEEKQLKETQTLQQGKLHPSKPCRVPPVWRGGAEKALEPASCRRCGGGGQERLYDKPTTEGTMTRRALVDIEGNTGANAREKSCEKPPAGHRHSGGLDKVTPNTRDGKWQHLQPREGRKCLVVKEQSRTNTTHKI